MAFIELGISKRENEFFGKDRDPMLNACVGRNGGPYDYHAYAEGYYEAAKRLIESFGESNRDIDILIYPIVFNFRHAIELSIKNLIQNLPRLWDEQSPPKWTHKLLDNWLLVKSYLIRDPNFDPGSIYMARIDEILDDLLAIDPKGEAFRYPRAKSGDWYLHDLSVINVESLYDTLDELQKIFDTWDTMISYCWEMKCDAETAYL